jgi:hypothetical protein
VVAFGLPASPPQHTRQVLKDVWPGISLQDKVVLWGGGLWQWLDPLTAIRAMERIQRTRADVRLVFPGTRHPNAAVPDMPMRQAALELAEQLDLTGRCVFFGDWVPYEDWPNVLIEADVALSLHLDSLEARLAFRSRVVDYIWADLPMVVSGGDATSDIAKEYDLGLVARPGDVDDVAGAILRLLSESHGARAQGFGAAKGALSWERTAQPLIRFCAHPVRAPDRVSLDTQLDRPVAPLGYAGSQESGEGSGTGTGRAQARVEWPYELAERDAEIARLRGLVSGYEQGRFMRLMRWLSQVRRGDGP